MRKVDKHAECGEKKIDEIQRDSIKAVLQSNLKKTNAIFAFNFILDEKKSFAVFFFHSFSVSFRAAAQK